MDRFGIGRSTRSKVREWLDGSGYSIQTFDDQNEFHFVMTDNIGLRTSILQNKANSPIVVMSPRLTATATQLVAFNALSLEDKNKFWRDVRIEFLRRGISFSTLRMDGDGVAVSQTFMMGPGLNGPEFLQRVLFVRSTARLYWALLEDLSENKSLAPILEDSPNQPVVQPSSIHDSQSLPPSQESSATAPEGH